MPHFDIVKKICPKETFRVANVMGTYDIQTNHIEERFVGDINLPDQWNIGLILGRSGTGKSTIAKELFGDRLINGFNWENECLLDDFPRSAKMNDIYKALNSVGFSSPPSWLKPYSVLSNGEKMRCDLARAIVETDDMFVFDEFTSVVDRNIAKIGSLAIQKALRRTNKKFIAVTCHYDVLEWLMPDWIFNTDNMKFQVLDLETQKKNRPKLNIEIFELDNSREKESYWSIFRKYHYLSYNFNKAAKVFLAYCNGELCAFNASLPFPHPIKRNFWKEHRTVVLPDFQGIGIGGKFTSLIAEDFKKNGKGYISTTSNPAMIQTRYNSKDWKCTDFGRHSKGSKNGKIQNVARPTSSYNRITASFEYVG